MPLINPSGTHLTGRCQCGKVKYESTSAPQSLNVCYCNECQRQSGSAFGLSLVVPSSGFKLAEESRDFVTRFERKADSGRMRGGMFCSACGVRLWHFNPENSEWITIKAGTLDQKVDFSAAQHIWCKSKLPGIVIPDSAEVYDEEPTGPV